MSELFDIVLSFQLWASQSIMQQNRLKSFGIYVVTGGTRILLKENLRNVHG